MKTFCFFERVLLDYLRQLIALCNVFLKRIIQLWRIKTRTLLRNLKNENEKLTTSNNEMNATLEDIRKRMKGLERDTSIMGTSLEKMTKNYNQIKTRYKI